MKNNRRSLIIVLGILLLLGFYLMSTFNSLVKKEEKVKLQWNEVQNVYQRRLDLIPNLVNIVKGQTDFEQTTLQQIAEARSRAAQVNLSGGDVDKNKYDQQQQAQDTLAAVTNRLIVSIEKYPTLRGTEAFAGLQAQLVGTERRIKVARKDFNGAIADYNRSVRSFPSSIAAKIFSFPVKEGFEADTNADKAIEIKF